MDLRIDQHTHHDIPLEEVAKLLPALRTAAKGTLQVLRFVHLDPKTNEPHAYVYFLNANSSISLAGSQEETSRLLGEARPKDAT